MHKGKWTLVQAKKNINILINFMSCYIQMSSSQWV